MTTHNSVPTGETRAPRWSLWRNRDFRRLWAGHTISMFGSQITPVAMPLIAAEFVQSGVNTIYGITRYSLRQAITPDRLRGRVDASSSFIGLLPASWGCW
jgi:hypothetical protein